MRHRWPRIRVMVVDRQRLFRDAVEIALELRPLVQLVAAVSDISQAAENARRSRADVALVTLDAGEEPAADVIAAIRKERSNCRVIALLDDEDDLSQIASLIRRGAVGIVSRRCSSKELVSAIEMAHSGGAVLRASILKKLLVSAHRRSDAPIDVTEPSTRPATLP